MSSIVHRFVLGLFFTEGPVSSRLFDVSVFDDTVVCEKIGNRSVIGDVTARGVQEKLTFDYVWSLTTVPVYLAFIVGPLLFFRSPTFFTKFNSLGTMSVMYVILYVIFKSAVWEFPNITFFDKTSINYAAIFKASFGAMSGMLSLSYFIHNIIISLVRNNKHQENNVRDLSIAYVLVTATYTLIGTLTYIAFPLEKLCIEDNFLNNFLVNDPLTVVARIFLFFQLITVYPLISYMLRSQVLFEFTNSFDPSYKWISGFNIVTVAVCTLVAIFFPKIGTVIRITGATSGFVHVFTLPCLLRLASLRKSGELTIWSMLLYGLIPILGGINILLQFVVSEK